MIIDQIKYESLFELCLSCSSKKIREQARNSEKISFTTLSHAVDLFKLKEPINLPEQFSVDGFLGWALFIEKVDKKKESITFALEAEPLIEDYQTDIATGEDLNAIEIYTEDWELFIGTQDESAMFYRSKDNLFFPKRFSQHHPYSDKFWFDLVKQDECSLAIQIPDLNFGEKIYFHLFSSWKLDAPKNDISAWVAVDVRNNDLRAKLEGLRLKAR
jgi:hypothetical protein